MAQDSYTRYSRKRRRWPIIVLALACALGALGAWQLIGVPRVAAVTPGPDAFVKDGSPTVVLDVHGLAKLKDLRVMLDGTDVTSKAKLSGDQLIVRAPGLADGAHALSFSATSSNLFRRSVQKSWRFTVDTSHPTLHLDGSADEGRINTTPATFTGTTEGYATVVVKSGALRASGVADASGAYAVSIKLPDGPSDVTITTTDRAGNATARKLAVFADSVPPTLDVTRLAKTVEHAAVKVDISAQDQLGTPKLTAEVDGKTARIKGEAADGVLSAKGLAQGKHTLLVTVADRGGNVVKDKQMFIVDSTEHFGAAVLWPGARGADVRQLQRRLQDAGVYTGARTAVYDRHTTEAVIRLQKKYGMEADGIVGGMVLNALSGQIVVDIGDLRLYLYRDGHLVKSYPVATGQPAYPTPTGSYAIITMTKDPTWLPPNSDWAKEAKPIPPGTENPLGTRWMGTSAPGVGIHGVPPSEDSSIGTYASHGCIRMHNWDAVDLFERVTIGMPVILRK